MTVATKKRPSARSKLTHADHVRLSRVERLPLRRISLVTRIGNVAILDCNHTIAIGPHGARAFANGDLTRVRCERCGS